MGSHSEGVGLAAVDAQDEAKLQKNHETSQEKRGFTTEETFTQNVLFRDCTGNVSQCTMDGIGDGFIMVRT